jgi:peroxiredoxin Q/BCP
MTTLQPGDIAPSFSALDQYGNPVSLDTLKGKKVILYFYPKDDTPGCTAEACNLRDNYTDLMQKGYAVIGISADHQKSHLKFTEKFQLPFPLIPDVNKEIIRAYGVWGPKQFMGKKFDGIHRITFVIDEDGRIEKVFTKVETKILDS